MGFCIESQLSHSLLYSDIVLLNLKNLEIFTLKKSIRIPAVFHQHSVMLSMCRILQQISICTERRKRSQRKGYRKGKVQHLAGRASSGVARRGSIVRGSPFNLIIYLFLGRLPTLLSSLSMILGFSGHLLEASTKPLQPFRPLGPLALSPSVPQPLSLLAPQTSNGRSAQQVPREWLSGCDLRRASL